MSLALRDALDLHIRTGTPVEIPATYLKDIEVPDFVQRLTGMDIVQLETLTFFSQPNLRNLLVRIHVTRYDGEIFTMDYVDLKLVKSGTEEATFNNEGQSIPFLVTVVLGAKTNKSSVSFQIKDGPHSVLHLKSIGQFFECFTKPAKASVVFLDTGIQLMEVGIAQQRNKPTSKNFMEVITDLVAIQERVHRPIYLPNRKLTNEERGTIAKLRTILHDGKIEGTWKSLNFPIEVEQIPSLIEIFKSAEDSRFRAETMEKVSLFETEIPLGRVSMTLYDARLKDIDKLEQRVSKLPEGTTSINIQLYPNPGNRAVTKYLDWQKDNVIDQDEWEF